ncbi:serine/threonine protein kinase [Nonomuraea cavernae]|nr:serine/threonine-protein kinase [Nonomuraea cavernae]MCA2186878.1 protein kinase [Nonomuraea cavernae]
MEPTGAAPLRPTDLREIGPYRLLGRLGEGGMGTVFLARAPTGRFVAVKVVKAEFANQEGFAARFHAEVENARRVASFCTAQVLDNGNTGDGRPYMVTEYIAGTPLSDQISKYGALDPGPLHGVALGVAAALAAIHVAGLVHRDLKPANVILSLSGPRVIDFGIARALDRETGFTMSGELLGSPGWWAPEQVRGQAVSPAADIFAWGCLIAYAGNGRHPFGRGDPITMATRVLHTPPDLGALPAPLNELVRLATSMEPGPRPSAQDLLIALVGGSVPAPAAADPPTLVATELLNEWEPPQNVVDEPDITATFATPPPSDTMAKPPTGGKGATLREQIPQSSPSAQSLPQDAPPRQDQGDAGSRPDQQRSQPGTPQQDQPRQAQGRPQTQAQTQAQAQAQAHQQDAPARQDTARRQTPPVRQAPTQPPLEDAARREEQAAREELARWEVRPRQDQPPAGQSPDSLLTIPPQEAQEAQEAREAQEQRPRGTRWLIAAAAAVLAIAVTAGTLIVTSSRNAPRPAQSLAAAPTGQPSTDVGRRYALGNAFDDPQLIVATAPQCGLKQYQDVQQTQGQLCVVRWSMINPGGALHLIGSPVVTLLDDKGARHEPPAVQLPEAIVPGARIDRVFVFDMPLYRRPVELTATLLKDGKQVEVKL